MKLNPQCATNRGPARRVGLSFGTLALVGLLGCQELSPTSGPAPHEELGVTTLALPGDSPWTRLDTERRSAYAGVGLGDGSVLVCGGSNTSGTGPRFVVTCNRLSFDGTLHSQSFPLPEARTAGTLTWLPPDRVLFAGGLDSNNEPLTARLSSAVGSWTNGGNIWGAAEGSLRVDHTASRLDSSVVLIGGVVWGQLVTSIDVRSDQGDWTKPDLTGTLATRTAHTATVLKSLPAGPARVLVLGGYDQQGRHLSTGFIFSLPNTITPIQDMPDARVAHTATLLDDGSVLVVGGHGETEGYLGTAWRYYPENNSWLSAGSTIPRRYHAAVRLGADVIVAGGESSAGGPTGILGGSDDAQPNADTVQRYDSAANRWSSAPNLHFGRKEFQLFALDQSHLLAVGGANEFGSLATSEVFTANALGKVASGPNSCVSGHFADGVCCDVECGDPCHWCNDPTDPGICKPVTGATPNENGCSNRVLCSQGSCAARCDAQSPCEVGYFCASDGKCTTAKELGGTCLTNAECAGGAPCVDGVCCESLCSGACEACNQQDLPGLCRALPEGAVPSHGHPSCPAAHDASCAASCDGHTTDRCVFPAAGSPCGDALCTSDGFQPPSDCDGSGTCVAPAVRACSPYACDQSGCLNGCQSDAQCAGGSHCNAGACTQCNETECNQLGYRCDLQAGACRNTCTTSERDCSGGYYCHPLRHQCVEAVAFPAADLPACSLGRGPGRPRHSTAALVSLLCAVAAWRTRRARRAPH